MTIHFRPQSQPKVFKRKQDVFKIFQVAIVIDKIIHQEMIPKQIFFKILYCIFVTKFNNGIFI